MQVNFIQVVGRIVTPPNRGVLVGNETYAKMVVEVNQNFKAFEGTVQTDLFEVLLWRGASEQVLESCAVKDLVAIKGRVIVREGLYHIVAEHVEILRP